MSVVCATRQFTGQYAEPVLHRTRRAMASVAAALLALLSAAQVWAQPVPVAEAVLAPVGVALTLEGSLQAARQATVAAQVNGRVLSLLVRAGDPVRAGQTLLRIDGREVQAQVARSDADVAQTQAQLQQARAQLERTRSLRAQGFVSQAALETAQMNHDAARAADEAARAGRQQSGVARSFAQVTAPFDGVVAQTLVEAGDLAVPGKPLLLIYAPQALRAVVQVPGSRLALARQARRIEVGLPDGRWIRPVRSTALPVADAVSQTTEWRLDLDASALAAAGTQQGAGVLVGQALRVRFIGAESQALVVPAQAVLRRGELTAVYVQAPGTAKTATGGSPRFVLRAVRLGSRQGDAGVEIAAGLKAGERVARDPVAAGLAARGGN